MTVSSSLTRISYVGDGVSVNFAVPFGFYASTDLLVVLNGVTQTLATNYTVTGGLGLTGTVTMVVAPAAAVNLQIVLNPPITQTVELVDGTEFPAATLNQEADRIVQIALRLNDKLTRSLREPDGPDVAALSDMPTATARAGKFLGFDGSGQPAALSGTGNDTALRTDLANGAVGPGSDLVAQRRTATEIADSSTPTAYQYLPGDVRRYGSTLAYAGANWFCYGHIATRANNTTFTIPGNFSTLYYFSARIRLTDNAGGIFMGRIQASTFVAGVTRIVVQSDGGVGFLGNVPATITSLSREESIGQHANSSFLYNCASGQGPLVWNRSNDSNAYGEMRVFVGSAAAGVNADGEAISGANSGLAIRATMSTRAASLLSGGTGLGIGASIVLHTGTAVPIIIGTNDQERLYVSSGSSAIIFLNAEEAARFVSPRSDDLGGAYVTFYENDNSTRKGYVGFGNGGTNNNLEVTNEKSASDIKIASQRAVWLAPAAGQPIHLNAGATIALYSGTGTPESAVTANVGSLFLRTDGGATTTLYVKTSGSGNVGWTAK